MDPAHDTAGVAASYDDIPYEGDPLVETHPEALATAATLLGMQPPVLESCRVLELGCGVGTNLIPMAESLPGATLLGLDFSPKQIAIGQAVIDAAGLTNVKLRSMDIMDFDASFGQFDYIICHGVFSWVPPPVQQKILDICAGQLSPNGVAFLSYNTYPGWHLRGMVREMLSYHAGQSGDAKARIRRAREFLELLARSAGTLETGFGRAVKEIADFLRPHRDAYVFHEYLEEVNEPMYFHEFAARLAENKLKYLGEPWLMSGAVSCPPELGRHLQQLSSDPLQLEQYADLVMNRTFRRSMVCHDDVRPWPEPSTAKVATMHVTTQVGPVSPTPDVRSEAAETFRGKEDLTVSIAVPIVKAALVSLAAAWPATLSFDTLCAEACHRLAGGAQPSPGDPRVREMLAAYLLNFYRSSIVSLHVRAAPFVMTVSPQPAAGKLQRYQARANQKIINLRHAVVDLNAFDRLVLAQLDGQTDQAAMTEGIVQAIRAGTLPIEPYLRTATDDQLRGIVRERLAASLQNLARRALLVA
jgi:methyltransferase-like protein/SAM-dependent methyltransferase